MMKMKIYEIISVVHGFTVLISLIIILLSPLGEKLILIFICLKMTNKIETKNHEFNSDLPMLFWML